MPTTEEFRSELAALIHRATTQGRPHLEVNAGELHRAVGGYPPKAGRNHAMPTACAVMREEFASEDEVVFETSSRHSASLTIRYLLPRLRGDRRIGPDLLERMRRSYRPDVAVHLAALASERRTITYGQLSDDYGRGPRLWGDPLGGIALRCSELGLPLLSVLVVNAASGMPSVDAVLYKDLGLTADEDVQGEQQRCFDFDWSTTLLHA